MSYNWILTPAATAQLADLPIPLSSVIRARLPVLAENPTALSKRSKMLQRPGQLFEFEYEDAGVSLWVSIIFRFGQDEQTLYIEDISTEFGA